MKIICLGNPGSGKTASVVREIFLNKRKTYSNIKTKGISHNVLISPSMIIEKVLVGQKKNGDAIFEHKLNMEFWKSIEEPIDIVLDEAHTILNARRSMSKINIIVTDWLALIRRVLGSGDAGEGTLYLISQLHNRVDIIAREMATQIRHHRAHYTKKCRKCQMKWTETSDTPDQIFKCFRCGSFDIVRYGFFIEIRFFSNMQLYEVWKNTGGDTFYKHTMIKDIEQVFPYYDTMQWENMFSEFY